MNPSTTRLPEFLIDGFDVEEIQRQEGFWLNALVLHVLNAVLSRLLAVTHNAIHVVAQHLCDSNLVALMRRLAHLDQTAVLK